MMNLTVKLQRISTIISTIIYWIMAIIIPNSFYTLSYRIREFLSNLFSSCYSNSTPIPVVTNRISAAQHYKTLSVAAGGCARRYPELIRSLLLLYDRASSDTDYNNTAFQSIDNNIQYNSVLVSINGITAYRNKFNQLRSFYIDYHPLELSISATDNRIIIDTIILYQYYSNKFLWPLSALLQYQLRLIIIIEELNGMIINHEEIITMTDLIQSIPIIGILYKQLRLLIGKLLLSKSNNNNNITNSSISSINGLPIQHLKHI